MVIFLVDHVSAALRLMRAAKEGKLSNTHLVVFQVPALDHFVQGTTEHVRLPVTYSQACHLFDVACEGQLQQTRREIPELDGPVSRASDEPLIG